MIHDSILDTIGRTPIVRLHRIAPAHVTLYAKVESFNPGGSVKDRLALAIILDAEAKGLLKPGDTVVEATSGNTGVALAMVVRGARLQVRGDDGRDLLDRAPQADARLRRQGDPDARRPSAAAAWSAAREELADAARLVPRPPVRQPGQPAYHRSTTAAEILRDFAGRRLDHFVTGWGTGGTLTGVGEVLKVARPEVQHHRLRAGRRVAAAGQGMAAAQDPGLDAGLRARGAQPRGGRRDRCRSTTSIARDTARRLAREEGIFVGISAGATVAAALGRAQGATEGAVILAMLPDTGERYLSHAPVRGRQRGLRRRVAGRVAVNMARAL